MTLQVSSRTPSTHSNHLPAQRARMSPRDIPTSFPNSSQTKREERFTTGATTVRRLRMTLRSTPLITRRPAQLLHQTDYRPPWHLSTTATECGNPSVHRPTVVERAPLDLLGGFVLGHRPVIVGPWTCVPSGGGVFGPLGSGRATLISIEQARHSVRRGGALREMRSSA